MNRISLDNYPTAIANVSEVPLTEKEEMQMITLHNLIEYVYNNSKDPNDRTNTFLEAQQIAKNLLSHQHNFIGNEVIYEKEGSFKFLLNGEIQRKLYPNSSTGGYVNAGTWYDKKEEGKQMTKKLIS